MPIAITAYLTLMELHLEPVVFVAVVADVATRTLCNRGFGPTTIRATVATMSGFVGVYFGRLI